MSFDFRPEPRTEQWRDRIAAFIQDVVVPAEPKAFASGVTDALRVELQTAAKQASVWAPRAPSDLGGGEFFFDQAAVLLEEAGTSLLGPLALNCAAPDEGNIHLLNEVATPAQRDMYLVPLCDGEVRSCFAMTEPSPGAGSDPSALRSRIEPRPGGGWVLRGRLRCDDEPGRRPVIRLGGQGTRTHHRRQHGRGPLCRRPGRHRGRGRRDPWRARPRFPLRPDPAGAGPPDPLHALARCRQASTRDRAASRGRTGTVRHAAERVGYGPGADRRQRDRAGASRALLWQTSWLLASGVRGTQESSRCKVFVSEAVSRVVDRSVQLAGGLGTSEELVIGRIYTDVRAFRIYDGSSETHRMSIARRAARRARG